MLQLNGVYFLTLLYNPVLKIHGKEGNNVAALWPQESKLPNLQVSGSVFIFKAQKRELILRAVSTQFPLGARQRHDTKETPGQNGGRSRLVKLAKCWNARSPL